MRIAMISEHANPLAAIGGMDAGGQNLHVANLAAALVRARHEVTVYTRRDRPDVKERIASLDGFDVVHVPAGPAVALPKDDLLPYMRRFGRWLGRRWRDPGTRPDIIHAHFWMSGVASLAAAPGRGIPIVLTYHALGTVKRRYQRRADTSPPVRIPTEHQLGLAVDRVIAQCPDEVAELMRLGVPGDSITVVPSGVDLIRFGPVGPTASRRPGTPRILTVGRLIPRKGYDDLIRVVAALPDVELVIAGGRPEGVEVEPEWVRLHELAHRLGVADRVMLVGSVPHAAMPAWYRSADVIACTPWYEPFGLTPLEAMACGMPVVAYAVGGLRDSVVDGVTGMHVEPGDVSSLIAGVGDLLDDAQRRRRYGGAGLARARARYSWDHIAAQMGEVYSQVAPGRSELERVSS
jgi:D-inositol-3-phosphate glycosyltransferase